MRGSLLTFQDKLGETSLALPPSIVETARNGIELQKVFPTTRHEAWKYTRLARVESLVLAPLNFNKAPNIQPQEETIDIVFENTGLTIPTPVPGVTITPADKISEKDWAACAAEGHVQHLNILSAQGGIAVQIAPNVKIKTPIRIIHKILGSAHALVLHHQIHVGAQSEVQVEYVFEGEASDRYTNVMLDVFLDENSRAHLDKFIAIEGSYYGFCTERIYQQKNSYCALQTITLNTHFTRNDLEVYSQGEGTHTQLYGAFFGTQQQLVDNHTFMHHLSPNCTSDEKYKGVLKDKATGVFNGKVKVYKDAQKINAFQSNRNLLLSDAATMNSKPELEIYADDVKCSHGCTTGQIDPTALYYLRARGISKEKAQEMLIKAFITDVVEAVKSENIKGKITKWLGAEI